MSSAFQKVSTALLGEMCEWGKITMIIQQTDSRMRTYERITDILRCKWALAILDAIERGINRPGRSERELPGLTTKVLNERVKKLVEYGLLVKQQYPEIPPRVEYHLTEKGKSFIQLISFIRGFADQ